MRFVICYKNADEWKIIKDDKNNFIIEKLLNNIKKKLKKSKLKCNLKIIDKYFYFFFFFFEKYKIKEI